MTNDTQKQIEKYEEMLDAKLIELLQTQNDIREFTESEHKAKDTKKYQKDVNKLAAEINDFIILLANSKMSSGDFKEDFRLLNDAGLKLNSISTELIDALERDLEHRQKNEMIDVKSAVGIMAGLAALAVTVGRFGLEHETTQILRDAAVGGSAGFLFLRKQLHCLKDRDESLQNCQRP